LTKGNIRLLLSSHHKKEKDNKHTILNVFDVTLKKLIEFDFSSEVKKKLMPFLRIFVLSKDKTQGLLDR